MVNYPFNNKNAYIVFTKRVIGIINPDAGIVVHIRNRHWFPLIAIESSVANYILIIYIRAKSDDPSILDSIVLNRPWAFSLVFNFNFIYTVLNNKAYILSKI